LERFTSYQQCTGFRTTLDFDRDYFWNGSSNRQANDGVINHDLSHVWRKQLGELWSTSEKMTLTFELWLWNSAGFEGLSSTTCTGSCKTLSSSVQRFMSYRVTNCFAGKKSENPVLWRWFFYLLFWNSLDFERLSRYMFLQNFIKLRTAVHEFSCTLSCLPYLTMVKNPVIRSCDLDLWLNYDLEILWISSGCQGTC